MANMIAPATQFTADGAIQLTKPAEWAVYMVDAAMKAVAEETLPIRYASDDEGKLEILKTLNFYEAHSEYEWPDFRPLGLDFPQTMRLRRALVSDVYVALLKNRNVQVGAAIAGTPDSSDRGRKRATEGSSSRAKRCCKRESKNNKNDENDDGFSFYIENSFWDNDDLLMDAMHELICRSGVDVDGYLNGEKSANALANIVHDGLVEVWDRPLATYSVPPVVLKRKQFTWAVASTRPSSTVPDTLPYSPAEQPTGSSSPELGDPGKRPSTIRERSM